MEVFYAELEKENYIFSEQSGDNIIRFYAGAVHNGLVSCP
jgi:hypothetical protein